MVTVSQASVSGVDKSSNIQFDAKDMFKKQNELSFSDGEEESYYHKAHNRNTKGDAKLVDLYSHIKHISSVPIPGVNRPLTIKEKREI